MILNLHEKFFNKTLTKQTKALFENLFFFQQRLRFAFFSLFFSKTLKMIDFKYLTTVMHEFHVFGKNKENKEISLLKTLLKR